jgi:hypothetical protein
MKSSAAKQVEPDVDVAERIMVALDAFEVHDYVLGKELLAGLPMVIIRTRDAGVHFGKLTFIASAQHGTYRVVLADSRRIWQWSGANTLNEVALRGISTSSKVSEPVKRNVIPQAIEVIPCTPESEANLSKQKW